MKKIYRAIFFAVMSLSVVPAFAGTTSSDIPELMVFFSPTCESCIQVKQEIMPVIEKAVQDRVIVSYCNIEETACFDLLSALKERHDIQLSEEMPVFYFQGRFLNGDVNISTMWRSFLGLFLK